MKQVKDLSGNLPWISSVNVVVGDVGVNSHF